MELDIHPDKINFSVQYSENISFFFKEKKSNVPSFLCYNFDLAFAQQLWKVTPVSMFILLFLQINNTIYINTLGWKSSTVVQDVMVCAKCKKKSSMHTRF